MKFDSDGLAIPGSYAIATVTLGGSKEDGTPLAFIAAAVCDVCGNWATDILTSGHGTSNEDIFNTRISRQVKVFVYACPDHYEQIMDSLLDEFGYASNRYEPDELALAVDRSRRRFTEPELTDSL